MSNDGTGAILTKKKTKVNRFGEAISQKKTRQGTAGAGLSAYEANPYSFYQTAQQRQPRISRKMRVKTPQISSNGKGSRRPTGNVQLISGSNVEKHARPTTAVGVSKTGSDGFIKPAKGRRFLGSAKPGNRRKLKG